MEMSDFAKRLQAEIDLLGTDRKALAEACGIPYHRMDPWFRRPKSKPRGGDLLAIARRLNVSQDYLLYGGNRTAFDARSALADQVRALDDDMIRELEEYARFLVQKQQRRAIETRREPTTKGSDDQACE